MTFPRVDGLRLDESDVAQVLGVLRRRVTPTPVVDAAAIEGAREVLQRQLSDGSISLDAFGREWRRLGRPTASVPAMPDEMRLRKARSLLADFSTLWRNPAVPDRLREEALHEIFARFDVQGSEVVAAHPQPNENAWLLGYAEMRRRRDVGMVGARGIAPPPTTFRSPCASPSRLSRSSWSGAHDASAVPPARRTRDRP